jgi:signal peptidase II
MQKDFDSRSVKRTWLIITISTLLVVLDEIFKIIVLEKLPTEGSFVIPNIFQLGLHKNFGIAFDAPVGENIIVWLSIGLILFFCWVFLQAYRKHAWYTSASALIIIGALGNLYDRLAYGYVVDYLIFFGRSAINLSDLVIIVGVVWFIIARFQPRQKTQNS